MIKTGALRHGEKHRKAVSRVILNTDKLTHQHEDEWLHRYFLELIDKAIAERGRVGAIYSADWSIADIEQVERSMRGNPMPMTSSVATAIDGMSCREYIESMTDIRPISHGRPSR